MRFLLVALFMVLTTHVGAQEAQMMAAEGQATIDKLSQGNADTSERNTWKSALPVKVIENPDDANHATERETKADKHDSEDLDAQVRGANAAERGATAAERQVVPTYAQAILGALGMVLLFAAFLYTKWTYDHSVSSSERQLRAYIAARTTINYDVRKGVFDIHVVGKNCGQTPAYHVQGEGHWVISHDGKEPIWPEPDSLGGSSSGTLGPNEEMHIQFETNDARLDHSLTKEECEAIIRGEAGFWAHGRILYLDVFGVTRFTNFRVKFWQRGTKNGAHVTAKGNESD